jgi:hypothetical protein
MRVSILHSKMQHDCVAEYFPKENVGKKAFGALQKCIFATHQMLFLYQMHFCTATMVAKM